ncbi:M48 family metallopeptidase [Paracidobacterium acidisoli]|nr:M48 family metallopeptidase [Paracidobacterium acidisoli]MBT9331034.1 M48 family metallopeptidase [Paracidobacterium acidisoli]
MSTQPQLSLSDLKSFPQLSPDAFQHADDLAATATLQNVPVFPAIVKFIAGGVTEKATRLHHLCQSIRVGPSQAVSLYRIYVKAAEILSIPELPELFISPESGVNAYSMGMNHHSVVVTRDLIETMTMPEIMGVLGHELGHVKCGHMVNKTIASMIAQFGVAGVAKLIPIAGEAALFPIMAHLQHWSRMAELSCDRAALLVVQDPKIVASLLAKLGGWPVSLGDIDFEALREQGEEYDELDNDSVAAVLKIINMLQSEIYLSHPLPIQRVRKILMWGESDMYRTILTGIYPRLDQALPDRRCPNCGAKVIPGSQFCSNCQTRLDVSPLEDSCPRCGSPLPHPLPKFCGYCGNPLSGPATLSS